MRKKVNAWKLIFLILILLICFAGGVVDIQDFATPRRMYRLVVLLIAVVLAVFTLIRKKPDEKCPHCGQPRTEKGDYCPHCGSKMM